MIDNRYKVRTRIGSGGMADVYLADDQTLGRPVAIKVMHERFAQDPEFVQRFEREAQAAASLQHKNVVNVFDRGAVGSTFYIAMEYLQGRSLKDVVRAMGALEPRLAIHIIQQILAAARFAHSKGVVHRDIKPQNVMIDDEWNVKVTDFGIAYQPASGDITQTGTMMGTAQYISPEQAQGRPVSAASDLYSIGVVLFEMLTGRVPFDGESSVPIALKHVNAEPPRPSALSPGVPVVLDEIVLHAMAKEPADRYHGAEEFSVALERALVSLQPGGKTEVRAAPTAVATPVAVVDEPPADNRRNWLIAALVAALLLAGLLAYLLLVGQKETVPNVVGRAVSDAQSRLAAAGFKSEVFRQRNPTAPVDEVFSQTPSGGEKAKKGSTIVLNVSSGPGEVEMPDIEGQTQKEAIQQLKALGLDVRTRREFSARFPRGIAIRTVPDAGKKAERGSTVDLYVSRGPKQVTVPDVVGLDRAEAEKRLKAAGFTVDVTEKDSPKPKDEVLEQTPASGQKADEKSQVKLVVASGSNQVPSVLDLPENDAVQELEDAGFKVEVMTVDVDNAGDDGKVVSQTPSSGKETVGSTVVIDVGSFISP
jgi:serine/threonine-protein kinase